MHENVACIYTKYKTFKSISGSEFFYTHKGKKTTTAAVGFPPKTLLPVNDQTKKNQICGQRVIDYPTQPSASPLKLQTRLHKQLGKKPKRNKIFFFVS